ncbi:MAG: hypothetical protein ABJB40_03065 [Acidobacteriota bacterium]
MVNRNIPKTDPELDKLTRQDAADAISYISETLASRSQSKDSPRFDDLIVSLTNAHENRRARQVTEWESMIRQNVQPMA